MGVYITADTIYGFSLVEEGEYGDPPELNLEALNRLEEEYPIQSEYYDSWAELIEDEGMSEAAYELAKACGLNVEVGGQDDYTYSIIGVSAASFHEFPWQPVPLSQITDVPEITPDKEEILRKLAEILFPDNPPKPEWLFVVSRG